MNVNSWHHCGSYEVSMMATVRMRDNIVVIGGADKHGKVLDTVIIYNVKTEEYPMLPSMRCEREGCSAVVIGKNFVFGSLVNKEYHVSGCFQLRSS